MTYLKNKDMLELHHKFGMERTTVAYSVEVTFSKANELVLSLYTYLCKPSRKRIDLGMNWYKETKNRLSAKFASELEKEDVWVPIHLLIWQCPGNQNVDDFINWFRRLSVGEIYEKLVPWMKDFPEDLGEVRDRMVYLLTEWNEQYFKSVDTGILKRLETEVENKRDVLSHYTAEAFGEYVTNGLHFKPIDGLKKVLFIPHYHSQPVAYLHHYGGITICLYSTFFPTDNNNEQPAELNRLTKALSDGSRLRILKILSKGPKTFTEIVSEIGLAKSTVHDHLIILRSAGTIGAELEGGATTSYRLRETWIDGLKEQLNQYLLG